MTKKTKVIFFTGAGISAESGVKTFRDSDGTWEEYDVMEVADISKWQATHNRKENRQYMLDFYNKRRAQLPTVHPNPAHIAIGELEKLENFDVHVITQNVDDLHERGGTTKIIHLHGELHKVRCTLTEEIYDHTGDLNVGDKSPNNAQLRPHIVWFGEAVPMMMPAVELLSDADVVIVCGTSLNVSPANMIFDILPKSVKKFYVNMEILDKENKEAAGIVCYEEAATTGIPKVIKQLQDQLLDTFAKLDDRIKEQNEKYDIDKQAYDQLIRDEHLRCCNLACPVCTSTTKKSHVILDNRNSPIVFGGKHHRSKKVDYYVCQDCGVHFTDVNKPERPVKPTKPVFYTENINK